MTTNDALHAVLIAHGYFCQDTNDADWSIFDKEEGPEGDEWVQTYDDIWQHRKDREQKGAGLVLAQGMGVGSLTAYLDGRPMKDQALVWIKDLRDRINNLDDSTSTGVGDDPPWINAVVHHLDAAGDVIEFPTRGPARIVPNVTVLNEEMHDKMSIFLDCIANPMPNIGDAVKAMNDSSRINYLVTEYTRKALGRPRNRGDIDQEWSAKRTEAFDRMLMSALLADTIR